MRRKKKKERKKPRKRPSKRRPNGGRRRTDRRAADHLVVPSRVEPPTLVFGLALSFSLSLSLSFSLELGPSSSVNSPVAKARVSQSFRAFLSGDAAADNNNNCSDDNNNTAMSFRYRPRSLLLRRTSSCSALPLNAKRNNNAAAEDQQHCDWKVNDGNLPALSCNRTARKLNAASSNNKSVSPSANPASNEVPSSSSKNHLQVPIIRLQPLREGVEHISILEQPDPPCHFCNESNSKPVHEDCTRLKIVSRGIYHTHTHISLHVYMRTKVQKYAVHSILSVQLTADGKMMCCSSGCQ